MSKITAILHHVDISLKEVNHVCTITNELGTHDVTSCSVSGDSLYLVHTRKDILFE
jgi:hypothetical protein